jgi:hypothetical protein
LIKQYGRGRWRKRKGAATIRLSDGSVREAEMPRPPMIKRRARAGLTRFALCIHSDEYPASLERRELYEVLPDADAEEHGQLRVIDESGEDFLYPGEYFQLVELSPSLSRLVRGQGRRRGKGSRLVRSAAKIVAG